MDETPAHGAKVLAAWTRRVRAALAIVGVASLFGSLPAVRDESQLVYDLSRLLFAAAVFASILLETARAVYISFGAARREDAAPANLYSMPRRFGLGTLLVVTLAFGILSTAMRWVQWEPVAILMALAFIAVVGFFQFVLDRAPRQASQIAGVLFFSVPTGIVALADRNVFTPRALPDFAFYAAWWVIAGALLGYCAGIVVGFVFMVMAGVRSIASAWSRPR